MSTSSDIILSKEQVEILKRIRQKGKIPVERINAQMYGKYKFLFKYYLIEFCISDNSYYELSDDGLMYLLRKEEKKRDFIKSFFSQFITGFVSGVLVTVISGLILSRLI